MQEKVEHAVTSQRCWLADSASALLMVLWIIVAIQPWKWLDIRFPSNAEMAKQRVICDKAFNFASHVVGESHRTGRVYKPKEVFEDIRKIRLIEKRLKPNFRVGRPGMESSLENFADGLDHDCWYYCQCNEPARAEFFRQQDLYDKWLKENGFPASGFDGLRPLFTRGWALRFGIWMILFYAISLPFVTVIYILRMIGREGVEGAKERIRNNPVQFVLAIMAFPGFIHRFPYDILWETWLEVQVRRLGNSARRKLTREEIKLIRTMDRRQYRSWKRQQRFRRNVAAAVLGMIFFILATGFCAASSSVTSLGKAPPGLSQCHDDGSFAPLDWIPGSPAILPETLATEPPEISSLLVERAAKLPPKRVDEIVHVPLDGRMVYVVS